MYIPIRATPPDLIPSSPVRWEPDGPEVEPVGLHLRTAPASEGNSGTATLSAVFLETVSRIIFGNGESATGLKRQTSVQDTNVTIGIVVGVLLAVFFAGAFAFMWIYRGSIRLARRRKRHHRKSGSSKSSKTSSDGGAPPAPPPAPAA